MKDNDHTYPNPVFIHISNGLGVNSIYAGLQ